MQEEPRMDPAERVVGVVGGPGEEGESGAPGNSAAPDSVHHPAKVMRIATMVRQLLDEVRHSPLDEASRARMADVYETSVKELGEVLSPDLRDELARLSLPFEAESPSDAELRIAHAQLVGWLEGLFHGIQAMLFAQQAESRARFEEVRRRSLPAAEDQAPPPGQGSYL
ncbi:MAG: bacterial proteasome activator family protein [Actinomycetota bacterium]|nr:bacterial proteasome activator family protein [Actinomycetota bacterium]